MRDDESSDEAGEESDPEREKDSKHGQLGPEEDQPDGDGCTAYDYAQNG